MAARRVEVLPEALANQIAAGEVVERPASVVKELVENGIDAGARRIDIEIETGGLARVVVADDGCGMDRQDAVTALVRHATSKIRNVTDLEAIESFGFRGEALPSMASVAKLTLRTKPTDAPEGVEIYVEGGAAPKVRPCGHAAGTTVEVADLFFNVPARRKFLRAVGTESAHITEVVQNAALAYPTLTFGLTRDGRQVRQWLRVSSRRERVEEVLREKDLAVIRGQRGPLEIEAFLSRPERARTGATGLHIFVNGRPVRDRALARAAAHAYGSVLEPGRYPVGALYLDIPFDSVDVNVHPQKAEVRFADGRAITDAVYRICADQLAAAFGVSPPVSRAEAFRHTPPPPAVAVAKEEPADVGPTADEKDPWGLRARPWSWSGDPASPSAPTPSQRELPVPTHMAARSLADAPQTFAELRYLGQSKGTYLVCEGSDGIYLLDQHAAAERVTFHRLRSAFHEAGVARQQLLFPEVIEVSPAEVALVEEHSADIEKAGLELRSAGASSIAIVAVPRLLTRASPERLARDLLAELGRAGGRAYSAAIDLALATMACHGSTRAGDKMADDEVKALLAALDDVDFAGHCPHGRPVAMRISFAELEHRVGRR